MSRSTQGANTHRTRSPHGTRGPAAPELYLILPEPSGTGGPIAIDRVAAMLRSCAVASCLVPRALAEALAGEPLNRLIGTIQAAGAAALIADDPRLALAHGADGVHLTAGNDTDAGAFDTARALLGADAIIGVYANTRHLAMVFGERGADYVALPYPDDPDDPGDDPGDGENAGTDEADGTDEINERIIAWWSALFEVPCVAMSANTPIDVADLARLGADFIAIAAEALGDWRDPSALAAMRAAIETASHAGAAAQ